MKQAGSHPRAAHHLCYDGRCNIDIVLQLYLREQSPPQRFERSWTPQRVHPPVMPAGRSFSPTAATDAWGSIARAAFAVEGDDANLGHAAPCQPGMRDRLGGDGGGRRLELDDVRLERRGSRCVKCLQIVLSVSQGVGRGNAQRRVRLCLRDSKARVVSWEICIRHLHTLRSS